MPLPCCDPLQLAAGVWSNPVAGQSTAVAVLREMAALEFAEETIIRAEDDCLVEFPLQRPGVGSHWRSMTLLAE